MMPWVIRYRCGCTKKVRVLRDDTGYCAKHGESRVEKIRVDEQAEQENSDER